MAEKYTSQQSNSSDLATELDNLQNQEGKLDPQAYDSSKYNPNKRKRRVRRRVYERFYELRDDPLRAEAERDWEIADNAYRMPIPEVDMDDWQSHLDLPDAFAAIQAQSQEDIERKARPNLSPTEESDEPLSDFANSVLTYNMNSTNFDYQYFLAKLARTIRGTSFLFDYWREEKRVVKEPDDVDEETGEIKYVDKEITDFDDDYTEWVANEFVYVDEKADHIDNAVDLVRREILNVEVFHRRYGNKPGFFDVEYVVAGGDTGTRSLFQMPKDISEQDVEILHYYNRDIDAYWCAANNVTIYDGPLPSKHKELPVAVLYQYRVPGQFWGMGIPKIIHMLSEERKSIRNLNMDRQKIIVGGAFIHNSAFDLDDEDEVLYPGKIISVDTGGQPVGNAIQQLPMQDVPASYFRTEEVLLEDIRRAHGIDDRIQGVNVGGTATEAAILKESALKRVNLINIAAEMDTILRIGRLKWSNIQFFYGLPRMEKIVEDNEEKEEKVYRSVTVAGKKFDIVDEGGKKTLKSEDIQGISTFILNDKYNKYLESSYDVYVDTDIFTPVSKAIEQTKKTELYSLFMSNPASMARMDLDGAMADLMKVNNIKPDDWLKNPEGAKDMMMRAEAENMVMAAGQPLDGTPGATEEHTLVHLLYTKTQEFNELPAESQQLIMDHILQEHDANPATGNAADLLKSYGLTGIPGPGEPGSPVPNSNTPFGAPGGGQPLAVGAGNTSQPQPQVADIQPTNFQNPE